MTGAVAVGVISIAIIVAPFILAVQTSHPEEKVFRTLFFATGLISAFWVGPTALALISAMIGAQL